MSAEGTTSTRRLFVLADRAGMLLIFVALFVGCALTVDNFLSWVNLVSLALSVSLVGMVACTMLFCLASGDFDLSVESVVAFSGVLAAVVIDRTGSATLGVMAGIAAGGLVGLFNGTVIAKVHVNALIATLATLQIVRGLGFIVSGGSAVTIANERFLDLGMEYTLGIPNPVWITLGCVVVFGVLLSKTSFGRHTLAIGGNRESARLAGIRVERIKVVIFTLQGLMAGSAGVILASRMGSGQPNSSVGFSLDVISACVLGGVSLSGGSGTMVGTVVGVLIMGTVQNVMSLMNVPPFYQYVARGVILLAAVGFDLLRQRLSRGRRMGVAG
ncbi:MAG: L-arabinose ABC transporter permease AraH [FCB group bacterium]|jgi:L-arabinose transport system permease protein|nr:L-arabinose ABC transporter permease AraH [FCB group bacterium]